MHRSISFSCIRLAVEDFDDKDAADGEDFPSFEDDEDEDEADDDEVVESSFEYDEEDDDEILVTFVWSFASALSPFGSSTLSAVM